MKKKYLAAIVGVMMAATSVTACGAATTDTKETVAESSDDKDTEDTAADSTDEESSDSSADADKESSDKEDSGKEDPEKEDVTYGEVKSVENGKITIAVGTMKEMGGNGEVSGENQGEAPSMLDLTGDEMTVTVTDDTVITKESTGGPGGAPGGKQGEVPEKPDGDNGSGEAPENPDGDSGNGQAQGGAPDGNNSQSENIEISDIQEDDIVAITTDDDGNALTIKVQSEEMGGGQRGPGGAPGGQAQGVDSYDVANTYDSDTKVSDNPWNPQEQMKMQHLYHQEQM